MNNRHELRKLAHTKTFLKTRDDKQVRTTESAMVNYEMAMTILTLSKTPNYKLAASLFEMAANKGHPCAAENLAWLITEEKILPDDKARKIEYYFKQAAASGSPSAQHELGMIFLYGECGVQVNVKNAKKYLMQAKAQGYALSANALSELQEIDRLYDVQTKKRDRLYDVETKCYAFAAFIFGAVIGYNIFN
jgi:TPR repeat protein